jgi:PAS domain S-box-containing protein
MELSDYKSVIDSSPYGYVLYKIIPGDERSHEFQCIAANMAFETITGFKSSDMIGKMHRQIFPDWENQDGIFLKLVEKRGRKKFDLMTRDGKRHVTVTAYTMADDMIVTCLSESATNHRSDRKLTESRKDYDVFYDLSKNLLCVFDMEGRLTRYNRAWAKRLGYPADDYIGKKYLYYVHPDDRESIVGVFGMMRSSERLKNFTCRLKDSKGDYKTFEWHAQIIDQHIFAIAQDITDQIHTHSRQWESSEKFRLIFENSPLGFMHYSPEGVITACNDNFVKIIGSSRKQLVGLNMFVLPDDRIKASLAESIKGRETTQIEIVYKSFTANKETPVRIVFVPVLSETGETMGGIGIIEDITERLNAARELMNSKEKYQMLFEEAADGVMIGVEGGTIIDANKAMTGVSGYEEHELVGRNVKIGRAHV